MTIKGKGTVKDVAIKGTPTGPVVGIVKIEVDLATAQQASNMIAQEAEVTIATRQLTFGEIKTKVNAAKKKVKGEEA